ncbi:MAG: U32 family peptidase [Muribaculaceae bacterium]
MVNRKRRGLELLSPAANAAIAIEAVRHGADAVYIGATSHGARKAAANSLDDIAEVVDYAHKFRSKVYVTVNTIIYDSEIKTVERLCRDLYHIGVDALIVQDMGMLRMSLPPIALHASTQCDIRTPEKARFLQEAGFSQLVLARELSLKEIAEISDAVDVPVECFVHGALCVSYSGKCSASCASTGRSANRGECAQICRLPFSLMDAEGNVIARDRHLLSLRDFNASALMPDLIEAGVSSFKIEGRLKDMDYVKNITSLYNLLLDNIVSNSGGCFHRSSFGKSDISFIPNPEKSFNRGFTDYFLKQRRPISIASLLTPKSMGETISDINSLNNGDGISFFDNDGNYQGVNVNKIEHGRIVPGRKVSIPKGSAIHRTFDVEWQKTMAKKTAERKIGIDVEMSCSGVSAKDERGVSIKIPFDIAPAKANKAMDYSKEFAKLGNTSYKLLSYSSSLPADSFIPLSEISRLRRELVSLLDQTNKTTYRFDMRHQENLNAVFPSKELRFNDNVANNMAISFYMDHGVEKIEPALETAGVKTQASTVVMTTRHCILRELGMCKKEKGLRSLPEPLFLKGAKNQYELNFNCSRCEMEVLSC